VSFLEGGVFLCFPLLQEYTFMPGLAHLNRMMDVWQWKSLHHPKFLPNIPLGTVGVASAESSVLQKRLHVIMAVFWRKMTVPSLQE